MAGEILVYVEQKEGAAKRASLEALTLGARLAAARGTVAHAVVAGADAANSADTLGIYDLPRRTGKIPQIAKFDCTFFGCPPVQANKMDPQVPLRDFLLWWFLLDNSCLCVCRFVSSWSAASRQSWTPVSPRLFSYPSLLLPFADQSAQSIKSSFCHSESLHE